MNTFLFCTTLTSSKGRVESRAGILYETPRGVYEAFVDCLGIVFLYFNIKAVERLPDGADALKLLNKIDLHKDQLVEYTKTRNVALWWELKLKIHPLLSVDNFH